MPVYEFRCESDHLHERLLPLSAGDRTADCPECGAPAARLISAPGISRLGTAQARAIGAAEESAHAPAVVDRLPSSGARRPARITRDPRHARLPRP